MEQACHTIRSTFYNTIRRFSFTLELITQTSIEKCKHVSRVQNKIKNIVGVLAGYISTRMIAKITSHIYVSKQEQHKI